MGNRAVITTPSKRIGIYVHWNGGQESIVAFLDFCKSKGYQCPSRGNYGWASLVTTITNFFGHNGANVGIDNLEHLDQDNGNNGVYVIENWTVVDRYYVPENRRNETLDTVLKNEILREVTKRNTQMGGHND